MQILEDSQSVNVLWIERLSYIFIRLFLIVHHIQKRNIHIQIILFVTVSEMATKIILTSEPSSGKFNDRVLLFDQEKDGLSRANQREVRVSRSSTEENPDTYNAVFECRVITLY